MGRHQMFTTSLLGQQVSIKYLTKLKIISYYKMERLIETFVKYFIILGFCLDVDNIFLVLLVLRWIITQLRCFGLGSYIPLDNNIYLHKVVAYFIFLHATIHTLAHLLNFGKLQ